MLRLQISIRRRHLWKTCDLNYLLRANCSIGHPGTDHIAEGKLRTAIELYYVLRLSQINWHFWGLFLVNSYFYAAILNWNYERALPKTFFVLNCSWTSSTLDMSILDVMATHAYMRTTTTYSTLLIASFPIP